MNALRDSLKSQLESAFSREQIRAVALRYGSALSVVAITILLRFWMDPILGKTGFALSLTGMLVAAWVGGLGPCLIGQTLILFSDALWFAPEPKIHSPMTLHGIISLIAFYSVGGFVAILSEASYASRKRAQIQTEEAISQRGRLRATLRCMADGVVVTDADGRVTDMNPAAEEMTGWTIAESTNKPISDVFVLCDEQTQEILEHPAQHLLRNNHALSQCVGLILSTRKSDRLPVSLTATPIHDGEKKKQSGIVMVIRNETERRQTEQALREADRKKDEFLATLAHELRNPLAPICMGVELLQASKDDLDMIEEVSTMMERQAGHMVRLVDDLLDVSRITRGKLQLRRSQVLLGEVIQNAFEAVRPAIEEFDHHLVLKLPEQPISLYADPNRLTQIFSNLLDNAAKYTPPEGHLEVSVETTASEVVVTVSDSGCGISSDQLEHVFEMFMQVQSRMESGHKGLGIGLTLVKQLVHMHGGTIEVESAGPGHGSQFRVRLPSAVPVPELASPQDPIAGDGSALKPRRVLIVDDNADALKSLSMLLKKHGNETFQAGDGLEAVEAAERVRPDVILMDIGMPRLNGYDAARRIREQPWGQRLMLIATTGWGQMEDRRRTKEAGFDHHLVKPIKISQVEELFRGSATNKSGVESGTSNSTPSTATSHASTLLKQTSGNGFQTKKSSQKKH